ncbi:hypothetical protein ACFY41_01840 [Streptomyces syringium]|uniref:hypothetical protein n=1 Tax=Streptomyces syringium TaxID=76729 RepID=UPI0036776E19
MRVPQRPVPVARASRSTTARPPPVAPVVLPASRPAAVVPAPEPTDVDGDQELILEELTPEQVLNRRNCTAADHQIVFNHIDRYGEASAQRLFTRVFGATVQRLSGLGRLDLGYTTWEQA